MLSSSDRAQALCTLMLVCVNQLVFRRVRVHNPPTSDERGVHVSPPVHSPHPRSLLPSACHPETNVDPTRPAPRGCGRRCPARIERLDAPRVLELEEEAHVRQQWELQGVFEHPCTVEYLRYHPSVAWRAFDPADCRTRSSRSRTCTWASDGVGPGLGLGLGLSHEDTCTTQARECY
jgi:hypothetical protein